MIVVREYSEENYSEVMESGYPFGSYLEPDFANWLRNFLFNRKEVGKFVLKTFFLNQEDAKLVAYSTEEKKAIGVVVLRKISEQLWGIWDIFVSPGYRGKRIASLLYQECFRFLKRKKVSKATGIVEVNNVPSVVSIERNWQGFLSKRIFKCVGKLPMKELRYVPIIVRKPRRGEKRNLYKIFKSCVGAQWFHFFEIKQDNFLDRVFGSAYVEPASKNILAKLTTKKAVLVAEYQNKLCGYAISRMIQPLRVHYAMLLFVPMSKNFECVSRALLLKALDQSFCRINDRFTFVYIGNEGVQEYLTRIGFEVNVNLVPYIYL